MKRTFVDAGVLIAAARGEEPVSEQALEILEDPELEFVSSIFLKMEVLPKAVYNRRKAEVAFYEDFFDSVNEWATETERIIQHAYQEATESGLASMDALHVAAAVSLEAAQLITSEKLSKSIHRTKSIKVISIHPA